MGRFSAKLFSAHTQTLTGSAQHQHGIAKKAVNFWVAGDATTFGLAVVKGAVLVDGRWSAAKINGQLQKNSFTVCVNGNEEGEDDDDDDDKESQCRSILTAVLALSRFFWGHTQISTLKTTRTKHKFYVNSQV